MKEVAIVNVESASLSPGELRFTVVAIIPLQLSKPQKNLREQGLPDPIDLECIPVFTDTLKGYLDLSPLEIEKLETLALTRQDALLKMVLRVEHASKIKGLSDLVVEYEKRLKESFDNQLDLNT